MPDRILLVYRTALLIVGVMLATCLTSLSAGPATALELQDILLLQEVKAKATTDPDAAIEQLEEATIKAVKDRPEIAMALIDELVPLYLAKDRPAEAGEALDILEQLVERQEGTQAPELAPVHRRAGEAYAAAGDDAAALEHFRAALAIDVRYLDCKSQALADSYRRVAELSEGEAAEHLAKLAEDEAARCAESTGQGSRGGSGAPFAVMKVYYGTDRARTGEAHPNDFYGGERGPVDFGTMEISIPREHRPGAIEAPSLTNLEWSENPEKHIVILKLTPTDEDALLADMRATLGARGNNEAFVFVHGYNVKFASAAKRTAQIAYDLNFDGAPILYSWPSRGSPLAYISDEAVVRLSGRHLMNFLDRVISDSGAERIHIIAHSMGNRAVLDALELMAVRQEALGAKEPLFDQVIFTAPDADAGLFANMMTRIAPLAKRLTLYASESDLALVASKQLHGESRAGQAGSGMLVLNDVDSIDMSVLGDDMLGHSYFATDVSALTDLSWLFWRDSPPDARCGIEPVAGEAKHFVFEPEACDGATMLSALTLTKLEGAAALKTAEAKLKEVAGDEEKVAEWRAITETIRRLLQN